MDEAKHAPKYPMIDAEYPSGDIQRAGATTVSEFVEKYGRKRFTSKTAPKSILISYLYDCYQLNEPQEGRGIDHIYPDMEAIKKQVTTYEDMNTWNAYLNLVEWQRSAFTSAVFMRNSLNSNLEGLFTIVENLFIAEGISAGMSTYKDPQRVNERLHFDKDLLGKQLKLLNIETYTPETDGYLILLSLRNNIEAGFLYMSAYNTFMDILADFTKIPEYSIQKVRMDEPIQGLYAVNISLASLYDTVMSFRYRDAVEKRNGPLADAILKTLEAFTPIGQNLQPMPEQKKKEALSRIKSQFGGGFMSWYSVFSAYADQYWKKVKNGYSVEWWRLNG